MPDSREFPQNLPPSAYEEDPSCSLTLMDQNGNYSHHSIEEVLARRLNGWKGWQCAAGRDGLFINADGNVYVATCKVGGILDNVFDGQLKLPKTSIECTKDWCMCGADMQLRKGRDKVALDHSYQPPQGQRLDKLTAPDKVAPHPFKANWQYPIHITWDLGRRCNFSCSYCHPHISNNYEAHKSFGSLKWAVDNLVENFSKKRPVKWTMTGGEPTVNPAYMDLVKYLTGMGHLVHTQTNFSRSPEYFSELICHSLIGVSLHLENLNEERFMESVRRVIETRKQDPQARMNWFGIRIMVPPGTFPKAKELWEQVRALPDSEQYCEMFMSIVHERLNVSRLMPYSAEELDAISVHS